MNKETRCPLGSGGGGIE